MPFFLIKCWNDSTIFIWNLFSSHEICCTALGIFYFLLLIREKWAKNWTSVKGDKGSCRKVLGFELSASILLCVLYEIVQGWNLRMGNIQWGVSFNARLILRSAVIVSRANYYHEKLQLYARRIHVFVGFLYRTMIYAAVHESLCE